MSRDITHSSGSASTTALHSPSGRSLHSYDLGFPSHRSNDAVYPRHHQDKRQSTQKAPALSDAQSTLNATDSAGDEDESKDGDGSDSNAKDDDDDPPEVNAPLLASNSSEQISAFSRAQLATAGLQNALGSNIDQSHGVGRQDGLPIDPDTNSSTKKRTFSDAYPSATDNDGNNRSTAFDDVETQRKKLNRLDEQESSFNAHMATDHSPLPNQVADSDDDNDSNDDDNDEEMPKADVADVNGDAFVDDDDYNHLNGDDSDRESDNSDEADFEQKESKSLIPDIDFSELRPIEFLSPQEEQDILDFEASNTDALFGRSTASDPFDFDPFAWENEFRAPSPAVINHVPSKRKGSNVNRRKVHWPDELQASSSSSTTGSSESTSQFADAAVVEESATIATPLPARSSSLAYEVGDGSDDSYWDVQDDVHDNIYGASQTAIDLTAFDEDEAASGSSGYESEDASMDGDSTDSEIFAPPTVSRPLALLNNSPLAKTDPRERLKQLRLQRTSTSPQGLRFPSPRDGWDETPGPIWFKGSRISPGTKLPPVGTFRVKSTDTIVVPSWDGKNIVVGRMVDPGCTCSSAKDCITGQPKSVPVDQQKSMEPSIPRTPTTPADTMNMAFNDLVADPASGSSQAVSFILYDDPMAFYNFTSDNAALQSGVDSDNDDDMADLHDPEDDIAIEDLISFNGDDSDAMDRLEDAWRSPHSSDFDRPTPEVPSESYNWFQDYDSSTMHAFRRNQDFAQQASRMPEQPELRNNLINVFRDGRDSAAESLITPPRRRRSDRPMESMALQT
ncbi:MAG: hypothetical protein M1820_009136 [Bogoriella megaspora]|nr:MAG: hypothetical protein M1820_009136 [Bogoriella megaspora]